MPEWETDDVRPKFARSRLMQHAIHMPHPSEPSGIFADPRRKAIVHGDDRLGLGTKIERRRMDGCD